MTPAAIQARIRWCTALACEAVEDEAVDGYVAEMAGLMGVPLAASLAAYQGRYDLGSRDRNTLLRLADAESN